MTVKEFYESVHGDYDMAIRVFLSDERLCKFLQKYPADPSYQRLCTAAKQQDIREAFEGAHAMKGICGMFYLTPLYQAVVALVEQIRGQNAPIDEVLLQRVIEEQERVLEKIAQLSKA